ncbi:AraC family transcriptional regulator [Enterococcus sp. JM4C]|uniref:helix-turn-helix transcriptional regulator n=1 Tax=Candidatus Enterococcus huntleyi TaxID=1857217 RepID=UPI0013796DCA|nr:response regulator transcription factor [Enterococcus sp. JM4C]KAF1299159.1 AraC family transcriptional regulator [Enterococcus sp. JM4C]
MKKSSVFYKIFLPVFLLGTCLVIGFSLYIYQNMYTSIENDFLSDKMSFLRQLRTNFERKIRTIEYSFSTYGSTRSFSETFTKELDAQDYIEYSEIRKELNFIEMMAMDQNSFDLISLKGGWGVINGSLHQLSTSEVQELNNQFMDSKKSLFWQKENNGIQMIITLPMFEDDKYAMGKAMITDYSIDQIIKNDSEDLIKIYNDEELLYSNQSKSQEYQLNSYSDELDFNNPKVVKKDGKTFILLKSDYNNWVYSMQLSLNSVASTTSKLRKGLFAVSLALIFLIGTISYLFSERFAKPIRQIQERLDLKPHRFKDKELDLVANSITKILGENQSLSANLMTQKPQLETLFILSLFRNRVEKRELEQRLAQFGYPSHQRYYTAAIQIDSLDKDRHGGEKDLLLMAINNIVTEIVPEANRMIPIVLNDEMQATIFRMDKDDPEASRKIMRYCQEIQSAVNEYLHLSISIGISKKFFILTQSKQSVDLAKEALHYRVNTGPGSIIFYNEIAPSGNEKELVKYPIQLQNQLFEAIRSGEDVELILDELVNKLFSSNKNPLNLEVALMRLINELVQLGQMLGVGSNIFENIKQIYLNALTRYQPKELKAILLEQLILPIMKHTQERTEIEFKTLSDKIMHIIQTEYDKDLSLDCIADRLHYNPNYLSSVFKKESGENFGDYVQNYRLDVAKQWLRETELPIKEIAERLQYRNPQNFIRFFKKKEQKTPGEYRKAYR